jgi:hypothetical protein
VAVVGTGPCVFGLAPDVGENRLIAVGFCLGLNLEMEVLPRG